MQNNKYFTTRKEKWDYTKICYFAIDGRGLKTSMM